MTMFPPRISELDVDCPRCGAPYGKGAPSECVNMRTLVPRPITGIHAERKELAWRVERLIWQRFEAHVAAWFDRGADAERLAG